MSTVSSPRIGPRATDNVADERQLDLDERGDAQFAGLRMTEDEFLQIPDDGFKYELLDGVVFGSPTPKPRHQIVAGEIFRQLSSYLVTRRVGVAFFEIDVCIGQRTTGADIVYEPDVIFVGEDRVRGMKDKIVGPPDLVVEVISRGSRRMDTITKRGDYERFGVREYWIMDPQREAMMFLRLKDGAFVEIPPAGDAFASDAVPGFVLNVAAVREAFKPW